MILLVNGRTLWEWKGKQHLHPKTMPPLTCMNHATVFLLDKRGFESHFTCVLAWVTKSSRILTLVATKHRNEFLALPHQYCLWWCLKGVPLFSFLPHPTLPNQFFWHNHKFLAATAVNFTALGVSHFFSKLASDFLRLCGFQNKWTDGFIVKQTLKFTIHFPKDMFLWLFALYCFLLYLSDCLFLIYLLWFIMMLFNLLNL